MGETRRLIKNTGIIAVGGMATKLVQFLLLPLYTSVLSTADYGTVDYINTIALFCVPAVSLLMDEALFRFLIDCRTDEGRAKAVTASCVVLLAGCVSFTVLAILVWLLFKPENAGWVVGLVVAGALLQMASAVLRGFGDTVGYSVMNFTASALTILLNVLFIAILRWGGGWHALCYGHCSGRCCPRVHGHAEALALYRSVDLLHFLRSRPSTVFISAHPQQGFLDYQ